MNVTQQEKSQTNLSVESGPPPAPINWNKFQMSVIDPGFLASTLEFVGQLARKSSPHAMAAIVGVAVIGTVFAKAACEIGGVITMLLLATIAFVERKKTMPRIAKRIPMVRLNLEMAEPVRQQLEHLRDSTNADSLSEVFRKALAVYDYLQEARSRRARIFVQDSNGEREVVIL